MKNTEELIRALRDAMNIPEQVILGEVISVDKSKQTADIKLDDSGNVTYTIRLKAIVDGNETGFVVFPEVGAKILAAKIYNRDDYYMLTCSKAQEVWLRGKENGDLINISDLVEKINRLESSFKEHLHITPSGVSNAPGTPKSSGATPYTWTNTSESDINDEKVKH